MGEQERRTLADRGHADVAPTAAIALAILLLEQGDVVGAQAAQPALQEAVDSDDPDVAQPATVILGLLLEVQEDLTGAQAAYQKAIDLGYQAPIAEVALGHLLELQEDFLGAQAAYQDAIDSGDADTRDLGQCALSELRLMIDRCRPELKDDFDNALRPTARGALVELDETDLSFARDNANRNALCPCGSGLKCKRCHGL